jgi:hypothetical protein
MGLIAPFTSIAKRPHRVVAETLGKPVPDGEGGYREDWRPLDPPTLFVEITPITGQDVQRLVPEGTVISATTHIVSGPYHPGLTTEAQLRLGARTFRVTGVVSRGERNSESVMLVAETTR